MQQDARASGISAPAIFVACSRIALSSFGSPLFWARRELVERQRWLSEQAFMDLLALGQLLPGPNVLNLLVLAGHRFAGAAGVAAAVAGFVGWPFLIVISLGMLHQRYGGLPLVQSALSGMSAVAAGLLLATGFRMSAVIPRHWRPWLCCGLAFIGVGILRWPFLAIVGVLAPYAIIAAWREKS